MLALLKGKKKEVAKGNATKDGLRLPKNAIPTHYCVAFKPKMEEIGFEASIAIDLKLVENSKQILLNASDLVVTKVMWEEDLTLNRQEPIETQLQDKGQLAVNFDPFLVPQEGQLRLNFRGRISDKKMIGFYRSKCKLTNDSDYNLITRFEPADARKVLPCWDEPGCKAPFDVNIIVPKGKTVLGNMLIKVTYAHKKNPALEIVEFKKSPPMSPFSLALVVGTYDYIEQRTNDDEVIIRVYTPPGKKNDGRFALEVSCTALPFLAKYFNFPFPLQKLDHIALADFPRKCRESWGLIMYQEAALLAEPDTQSPIEDKLNIALNVCEETVKQWIGSLVSIDWWSQLWIKEGLATFLKYFCIDEVCPDFEAATHFVNDVVIQALNLDGIKSTRSLELPIHNLVDMEEIYDEMFYKKGASVFRMLHSYIGDENFLKGLNIFLNRYKFKSATADDLWKCFEEASSKPVAAVMATWATHKGFPLIKVTAKQDGKNRFLKLIQDKFTLDPTARETKNESVWMIPLTVTSGEDPTSVIFHTLMDSKTTTIVIPNIAKTEWVKLNSSAVGFYRVRYPPDMIPMLVHAIRDKSLEPLDRLNVLDDQFAFLISGMGYTVEVLTLMEAFMEEDDYNVWVTISKMFDKLIKVFAQVGLDESVRHFGRYLYTRVLERCGFTFHPQDSQHQTLLRGLILRMMIKFNHADTINKSKAIYDAFLRGETPIPVEARYIVYKSVLMKADEDTVKSIVKVYKELESAGEKHRIASVMGVVRDIQMIKYILEFAISDDVRKQSTVDIILSVAQAKAGRELAWNFFKDNFIFFKLRYGPALASKLIKGIAEDFASEEKAVEITEYFKINQIPGTERAIQQAVDSIRINDSWLKHERNLTALQDYMEADAI